MLSEEITEIFDDFENLKTNTIEVFLFSSLNFLSGIREQAEKEFYALSIPVKCFVYPNAYMYTVRREEGVPQRCPNADADTKPGSVVSQLLDPVYQ